jgi:hypothetical protein
MDHPESLAQPAQLEHPDLRVQVQLVQPDQLAQQVLQGQTEHQVQLAHKDQSDQLELEQLVTAD